MIVNCDECGKEFNRKPSEVGKNIFCNKTCYASFMNGISNSKEVLLNRFIKSSWVGMNLRAGKYRGIGNKVKNKVYKNVIIEFTREQYKSFCFNQIDHILSLNRPSVDRINPDGNYTLSNIQFIELSENVKKSRKGNRYTKNSFGLKRGIKKEANGKFTARITQNSKGIHLGVFETAENAYEAFKIAYFNIHQKQPW